MQQGPSQNPVEIHREWCRGIEATARQRAGRPLTTDERDKIWNCGSFHFLEILERDVTACRTPVELEKCLAEFPFLGPLPPEYTGQPLDYEPQKSKGSRLSWLPLILLLGFIAWMCVMFITNHGD